jgi:AraC-like DNA-binding protein
MSAWQAWLQAIADPRCELIVTVCAALDRNEWNMGARRLDDHMLHAVVHGGHEGLVDGRPLRTRPGDLLWVPPGMDQVLRKATGERRFAKRYLRFRLLRDGVAVPWPAGEPLVRHVAAETLPWFDEMVREHRQGEEDGLLRMRALLVLVFTTWSRSARHRPGMMDPERRGRLLALIADRPMTGSQLAASLGLSPLHLARQVRATWGISLRALVVRARLQAAAHELRSSDASIQEIARRHGWEDPFLFSRLFRTCYGVPPRSWREG